VIDKDTTIRLAHQSGYSTGLIANQLVMLNKFANACADRQREIDAGICDAGIPFDGGRSDGKIFTYPRLAEAIRNHGTQK